jgi:hypothetical protein
MAQMGPSSFALDNSGQVVSQYQDRLDSSHGRAHTGEAGLAEVSP